MLGRNNLQTIVTDGGKGKAEAGWGAGCPVGGRERTIPYPDGNGGEAVDGSLLRGGLY